MTSADIEKEAAIVRRHRLPTPLYKTFDWYKKLSYDDRVDVEELIGLCVGVGPVTAECWVQVRALLAERGITI